MTEAEWLSGRDPDAMFDWLRGRNPTSSTGLVSWLRRRHPEPAVPIKASPRKLLLYACACCRRIWDLLRDARSRRAIEVAEQFADGLANEEQCRAAMGAAWDACQSRDVIPDAGLRAALGLSSGDEPRVWAARAATCTLTERPEDAVPMAVRAAREAAGVHGQAWAAAALGAAVRTHLLYDLFGNPFRPVSLDPSWLTWHGGLVVTMARRMDEESDFSDLPVLADALEDAGCDNADLLGHCRQPGEHARGCWALDIVLGRS
jgi:hypothetical protein